MKYIDIGANLTSQKYSENLNFIIKDSFENNLDSIIITGTTVPNSLQAYKLVSDVNNNFKLYCTAGIHPHNAKSYNEDQQAILKDLLKNEKVVAVGECGLDYNRNFSPKNKQLIAFEKQVQLAIEVNKPLFLHERDAKEDFIKIMSEYKHKIRAVVHCFTGNKDTVKEYVQMGFYIGITGIICNDNRNSEVIEALKCIPLDKLMVETDCPFMSPNEDRVNVPKNIKYVVKKISEILNINEELLANQLIENTKNFFNIK